MLFRDPVDLRKAHNGLSALVTQTMQADLISGDVFLFVSKDRKAAKALFWDGSGLCLLHKRMERTRVMAFPAELPQSREITAHEFTLILGGAKVTLTVALK